MANYTKGLFFVLYIFIAAPTVAKEGDVPVSTIPSGSLQKASTPRPPMFGSNLPPQLMKTNTITGLLEVYFQSEWRIVTTPTMMSNRELQVLCRSMGLPAELSLVQYKALSDPPSIVPVSMYLECRGNETDVHQCQAYYTRIWSDTNDVTISLNCQALIMAFTKGQNNSGIIETRDTNSNLTPFCADAKNFDNRGAQIICRKLGLPSDHAINTYQQLKFMRPYAGMYQRSMKLNLVCPIDTAPASLCHIEVPNSGPYCTVWGILYSNHLVAVTCTDEAPQYRRTNVQPYSGIGRLEVRAAGEGWGTVCGSTGSFTFAKVACKSLNLPSSGAQAYADVFYGGALRANLHEGACNGTETDIIACPDNQWGKPCTNEQYIGLKCGDAFQGQLRVSGLNGGLVEMYYKNAWYQISVNTDPYEASKIAIVVCRTLNMSTEVVNYKFGLGRRVIPLESAQCTGNEKALSECSVASADKYLSAYHRTLYVQCDLKDEAVRLEPDGLLHVHRNGRWGTVCIESNSAFSNFGASIICRSLNRPSSLASVFHKTDVLRSGPVSLHDLRCNSSAMSYHDCTYDHWTDSSCDHKHDVFIRCEELDRSSVKYRLKSDHFPNVGIFEMSVNGVWGSVAMRGEYIMRTAQVYCRSVNLTTGAARFVLQEKMLPLLDDYKIWLDDVICNSTELSPLDCRHMYIGDYVQLNAAEPVIIACLPDIALLRIPNYSLRLGGGSTNHSGLLEMYMYGTWKTLCSQDFTIWEARVACRSMDLPNSKARLITWHNTPDGNPWQVVITCTGGFQYSLRSCVISRSQVCTTPVEIICEGENIDNAIFGFTLSPFQIRFRSRTGWSTRRMAGAVGGSLSGLIVIAVIVSTIYRQSRARRNVRGRAQGTPPSVSYATGNHAVQFAKPSIPI